MRDQAITSRDNSLIKRARAVRDGKVRDLIFIEGVRLAEEAARSALSIADVLYTERLAQDERGKQLLRALNKRAARITPVSERVLASVADTKTPQGIVVLAQRPDTAPYEMVSNPLIVIMHRINNPSNAGAILRAAEAAGATLLLSTTGSTDLFSPKALRGAMGSTFRLPIREGVSFSDALYWCAERGIRTVSTAADSARAYTEINWTTPHALIVGEEGAGLERDEIEAADVTVRIPMRAPVKSLNVAVATAIVLYEAARQRGFRNG